MTQHQAGWKTTDRECSVRDGCIDARFVESFERIRRLCGAQARGELNDDALFLEYAMLTVWPCLEQSLQRQQWRTFTAVTDVTRDVDSAGQPTRTTLRER
jgi:hypothetical protein